MGLFPIGAGMAFYALAAQSQIDERQQKRNQGIGHFRRPVSTQRLQTAGCEKDDAFRQTRKNPGQTPGFLLLLRLVHLPVATDLHPAIRRSWRWWVRTHLQCRWLLRAWVVRGDRDCARVRGDCGQNCAPVYLRAGKSPRHYRETGALSSGCSWVKETCRLATHVQYAPSVADCPQSVNSGRPPPNNSRGWPSVHRVGLTRSPPPLASQVQWGKC